MNLPNRQQALIEPLKLEYLLKDESKTGLFRSLGFTLENMDELAVGLNAIAGSQPVGEEEHTKYGIKYVVRGHIDTPSRGLFPLVTVWIIDNDKSSPRLVTAYRDRRRSRED